MQQQKNNKNINNKITRRQLLKKSVATGVLVTVMDGFVMGVDKTWALEAKHIKTTTLAALIQIARDIYPHDKVADEYYAKAVKGHDNPKQAQMVEDFVAKLDQAAGGKYLNVAWEEDRVKILRKMQNEPFFQNIRGGLVVGLYNQKNVWPIFGYEGESYSKGGYINRGFDDINWL